MLPHTFCHLPGVGPVSERRLWQAGYTLWQQLLDSALPPPTGAVRDAGLAVQESIDRFGRRDFAYFGRCLPAGERWRLFHAGRSACVYLDIETTGLGVFADITTVALYDGCRLRTFVAGRDLDGVPAALAEYSLIITYNGACFDLPVLERFFGILLPQAHIDVRYALSNLGIKGGLKGCERRLGIQRPGLEEVDGFFAVRLWHDYQRRGDPRALETLLAYNVQDTVNLQYLMIEAYNRKVAQTPFHNLLLPQPPVPDNPYTPDAETIARLQRASPRPLFS